MHIINKNRKVSPKLISKHTGFSIGKVNFCIKALIDISFIKIHNLNNSINKLIYTFFLTPTKGIREKTALTMQFITQKKQEYDKLKGYIYT